MFYRFIVLFWHLCSINLAGYDYPARMSMLHWPTPTYLLVLAASIRITVAFQQSGAIASAFPTLSNKYQPLG